MNVTQHFFNAAKLHPDKIAIETEREKISYALFEKKVNNYIQQFIENGIESGDKILILHPLSIELYASLLALLHINCTLVFVEEWTKISDIIQCQKKIKSKYIICSTKINLMRYFIPEINQLNRISLKEKNTNTNHPIKVNWKDEAIVSFSSGSSGKSKAIIRTHDILNAQFNALKNKIIPCHDAKMMSNFPVVILLNLGLGITSYFSSNVILSKLSKTNFNGLYQDIINRQITHVSFSPFLINQLAQYILNNHKNKLNLFQIISGGSPFFPSFVENISNNIHSQHFVVLYGSSEAEPIAHCNAKEILNKRNEKGLYAGVIDTNCNCFIGKIKDGVIEKNEHYEAGEIFVNGNHVVKNYYNSEEMQAKNKVVFNNEMWHRTGDYGYFDSENHLFLTGDINRKFNDEYVLENEKKIQEIKGIERATLLDGTAYVQVSDDSNKKAIKTAINECCKNIVNIRFITMPLDRRHHGKIKYKEL